MDNGLGYLMTRSVLWLFHLFNVLMFATLTKKSNKIQAQDTKWKFLFINTNHIPYIIRSKQSEKFAASNQPMNPI